MFYNSPEEYKAAQEKQQMTADQTLHEVFGWLERADSETLEALKRIFVNLSNSGDKACHHANYYVGMVEALASQKYGVCLACGKHHGDELAAILTPDS